MSNSEYPLLTQENFYPPQDNRVLRSGVINLSKYTYSQYLKEYYELCDNEEIYDEKIFNFKPLNINKIIKYL